MISKRVFLPIFILSSICLTFGLTKQFQFAKPIETAVGIECEDENSYVRPIDDAIVTEALFALEIPQEEQAPTYEMIEGNPYITQTHAYYDPQKHIIVLNRKDLEEMPYGLRRCMIFHEVAHSKLHQFSNTDPNQQIKIEHEADFEGIKTTQCHMCTHEMAMDVAPIDKERTADGYLSVKEINALTKQFRAENKVCEYHRNANNLKMA